MCLKKNLNYRTIKVIVVLLVVLLSLGILGYWSGRIKLDNSAKNLDYDTKTVTEESSQPVYQIKFDYPVFVGSVKGLDKANQEIYQLVSEQVAEFRNELFDWPIIKDQQDMAGSSLQADYEIINATDKLISLRFNISSYLAGAAHPNSFSKVINYSVRQNKLLILSVLFKPGSNYLKVLSDYAIKNLSDQPELKDQDGLILSLIEQGASPSEDNFSKFTIKPSGLEFYFDPYQVAPYAAGLRTVLVPWSVVKNFLNDDLNF